MNDLMTIEMTPMQVAQVFTDSRMFPDAKSVAIAATKLIVGRGMGLSDYDAMAGLNIIQGKVTLTSALMAAAIKRSGKYEYESVSTDESCTITFYDVTGKDRRFIGDKTWTMETAKRAGLNGQAWRKYPEAMLFARCISAGYREHCPDALGAAPVYVQAHGESEIPEPKVIESESRALPEPVKPTPAATWKRLKVETVDQVEIDERQFLKLWGLDGEDEFLLAVDDEELFSTVHKCVGTWCEYQLQATANSPRVLDVRHPEHEDEGDEQ